jgi:hypothetical protein
MQWTKELDAKIQKLRGQRLTWPQVAARMQMTENQVHSRAARNGWLPKAAPRPRQRAAARKPKIEPHQEESRVLPDRPYADFLHSLPRRIASATVLEPGSNPSWGLITAGTFLDGKPWPG